MNEKLKQDIKELREAFENTDISRIQALIGADGFVDEIVHVVDTRKNAEEYTRIKTLKDYGMRIAKSAGFSTNVEMVTMTTKLGGNGPILSNALMEYGAQVTYIGALGKEDIHPVFKSMIDKGSAFSIADPAHTDAIEFEDGKLMVGKLEPLKEVNWENIKQKIGLQNLGEMIRQVDLFGMENWTMIPYMSEIWRGMIQELFPLIQADGDKKYAFFDLADPEKRTKEDIWEALQLIKEFGEKFHVILGLNKKEAQEIAEVLQAYDGEEMNGLYENLEQMTRYIGEKLAIYCVLVHPVDQAATYCEGMYYHTYGPYTANPLLTTGAGDNFNAGFCIGQALGLSVQQSLVLGTATSGYYVRNGNSPSKEALIAFLCNWEKELGRDH